MRTKTSPVNYLGMGEKEHEGQMGFQKGNSEDRLSVFDPHHNVITYGVF